MRDWRKWAAVLSLQLLTAAALADGEEMREQALQALASADAGARRDAVTRLGDLGVMDDSDALIDALHDDDDTVRMLAEQSLWKVWMRSGDRDVDDLLREGMRQMESGKMAQAVDAFTRVIDKRPDFAEGWNKRATAWWLIGDEERSLQDCDETLKRNPNHFGALSGCGLIYAQRDQLDEALDFLERALAINPNMPGVERGLALVRHRLGTTKGRRST